MTKDEIIAMVRSHISDEQAAGYPDGGNLEEPWGTTELLAYLDRAVDAYSRRQAEAGDIRLLRKTVAVNGTELPEDFIAFAGNAPVDATGGVMTFYGPTTTTAVKYFARLPYVTAFGDGEALPYDRDQEIAVAELAAIYALNKHEFNVSQDLALLGFGGAANADAGQ